MVKAVNEERREGKRRKRRKKRKRRDEEEEERKMFFIDLYAVGSVHNSITKSQLMHALLVKAKV